MKGAEKTGDEAGMKILIPFMVMIFIAGYAAGYVYGSRTLGNLYMRISAPVLLFFRPSMEHLAVMNIINDPDDEKRISGYYALLDHGNADPDILKNRYESEDSLFIKRCIIWIMGFSRSPKRATAVLSDVYKNSPMTLKKEILRSLRRIDRDYYNDFIKGYGISKSMIEETDGRPCQINLTF